MDDDAVAEEDLPPGAETDYIDMPPGARVWVQGMGENECVIHWTALTSSIVTLSLVEHPNVKPFRVHPIKVRPLCRRCDKPFDLHREDKCPGGEGWFLLRIDYE